MGQERADRSAPAPSRGRAGTTAAKGAPAAARAARPQRPAPRLQRLDRSTATGLQRSAGNAAVSRLLDPTVQRAPQQVDLSKAAVTYAWTVTKGALGPKVVREPDTVLKEDLVTIRATVKGVTSARDAGLLFDADFGPLTVESRGWVGNNGYQWAVRASAIGAHGTSCWGTAPNGAGVGMEHSMLFVLTDLSDFESAVNQAHIRLHQKYADASRRLNDSSTAYNAAYTSHGGALKEAERQEKLDKDLLLGLLFAGLGGFLGGATGAVAKNYWESFGKDVSKKVWAEGGTDLAKDLVKFATRNVRRLEGGSEGTGDSTGAGQSVPAPSGAGRTPVSEDPLTMLTGMASQLDAERSGVLVELDGLMTRLRTAKGRTPDVTFEDDPLAIVDGQDAVLDSILGARATPTTTQYLADMWGAWIAVHGYRVTEEKRIREQVDAAAKACGTTRPAWGQKHDPTGYAEVQAEAAARREAAIRRADRMP